MEQDRTFQARLGLQLGDILIGKMNIPGPFDLGQHDHIQLVARLEHKARNIILEPWRIQRIDPAPEARALGLPVDHLAHFDSAVAGRILGICRDGIL